MSYKDVMRLLDTRTRTHNRRNSITFNDNESFEHLTVKFIECYELHLSGKQFYTEAIFANGLGRADIFWWDEEEFGAIEIVHTEDVSKSGKEKYPCPVRFVETKGVRVVKG